MSTRYTVDGRVIFTNYVFPSIPLRRFDWSAVTGDYEAGDPVGWGTTEQAAIADLLAELEECK